MDDRRSALEMPGGKSRFLIGLVMAVAFLLTSRIAATQGDWMLWGRNAFGLSMLPFLAGIGLVAWKGRSIFGWTLLVGGSFLILDGAVVHREIFFERTSLFSQLLLVLLFGGLGWMVRGVRARGEGAER